MQHRALALALALLLLVTQQFGLQHLLSHGSAAASWVAAGAAADASPAADGQPADGSCAVCVVLASIGFAVLPALLLWLAARRRGSAPPMPAHKALDTRSIANYLARAPPAPLAMT